MFLSGEGAGRSYQSRRGAFALIIDRLRELWRKEPMLTERQSERKDWRKQRRRRLRASRQAISNTSSWSRHCVIPSTQRAASALISSRLRGEREPVRFATWIVVTDQLVRTLLKLEMIS